MPIDIIMPEPSRSVAPPAAQHVALPVSRKSPRATPLAARLAGALGVDLASLKGSGIRGRVLQRDVIGPDPTMPQAVPPAASASVEVMSLPEGVAYQPAKLSSMFKTIARRLTQSKQTVPHFYLSVHSNLDPLLKLRAAPNADLASVGVKLSVNDLLVKALAKLLLAVPAANVQFGGDSLHMFERVDVSLAVAIPSGLVTPVLRDVGGKSVSAIAAESKALAAKARDGKLVPEDYQGGTVSISNLGMFEVSEMLPVINPPQAMILGIAAGEQRPWVVGRIVVSATVMTTTASFDHHAIDGVAGSEVARVFSHADRGAAGDRRMMRFLKVAGWKERGAATAAVASHRSDGFRQQERLE